jgi:hypothetical protein
VQKKKVLASALSLVLLCTITADWYAVCAAGKYSQPLETAIERVGEWQERAQSVELAFSEENNSAYAPDLSATDYLFRVDTYADATVYQADYSSVKSAGDDEIAQAVAEYKAEQARIAAEKAKAEKLARGSTTSSSVASEMTNNSRMIGRLYINSIDMSPVAVYASDNTSGYWGGQTVTDRKDSAFAWACNGGIIIGDHVNQNFSVLKNASVGTVAYLNRGDSVITLKCIGKQSKAYCNGEYSYFTSIASSLGGMNGHILMYTCNNWPYITATLWEVQSGDFSSAYSTCKSYFNWTG